MPYVGGGAMPSVSNRGVAASISQQQTASVGVQGREFNIFQSIGGYIGGGALDLVDTIASSVPGTPIDRGQINSMVLRSIDQPGLNQFMAQNAGGIEVASGIAGIVGAELLTRRFTGPASQFMGLMRKTPYLRRLAALDQQYDSALAAVATADMKIASRGIMGSAQYTARARVDTMKFDSITGLMAPAIKEGKRSGFVSTAKALAFAKGARSVVATEAVMAVTLNQNGFLYDDSMAQNIAWGALGVGLGGGLELANSAYRIRKFANSDAVRRQFSNALDPEQIEAGRLSWMGSKFSPQKLDAGDWLAGSYTDQITSLNVGAAKLRTMPLNSTDNAQALMQNRDALATQQLTRAREFTQMVTSKGIDTDGATRFSMTAPGYGNHVDMLLKRDPGALYQAEMVGGVAEESSTFAIHNQRMDRLDQRLGESTNEIKALQEKAHDGFLTPAETQRIGFLQERVRRLGFSKDLVPMAAIDGELMPLSEALAFEGFVEPQIKATTLGQGEFMLETVSEARGGGVTLDDSLNLTLPGKAKTLDTADHYDIMRAYRLADSAIDKLIARGEPITIPRKANWFQLDMAEEVLKRSNGRARVVFPESMTRESAQVESLVQKAEALAKQKIVDEKNIKKADATDSIYEGRASKLRLRYNLPRLSAYERGLMGEVEHPVEVLMRGINDYGPDEVRKMPLQDVLQSVAEARRLRGDVSPILASDTRQLYGASFKFMKDESGAPIKPLMVYKRPFIDEQWTVDTVTDRLAAAKIKTVTTLLGDDQAVLTKNLTETLINSEDFRLASRPDELMDTQIQGNIRGAAPDEAWSALSREFMTSEWNGRDTPGLLAAIRLSDTVDRVMRDNMKRTIEVAFEDSLAVLANPRNAGTRLLLDTFHSFRSGWDLESKAVKNADGMWTFKLGDTAENRERFLTQYGREMSRDGELLTRADGSPIGLDDLGMDVQQRFNAVSSQIIKEKNTLLKSMTRNEIKEQNHFVPSADVEGRFQAFVIGPDGKTLPGYSINESTKAAYDAAKEAIEKKLRDEGKDLGFVVRSSDEIRRFANIWDRVEMDMINPGTTAVQPNKRGKGNLVGPEVRIGSFEESLSYLQNQFAQHGQDVLQTLMREQITSAEARANIARGVTRTNAGKNEQSYRTIQDYYLENLRGTSKSSHSGSIIGSKFRSIEAFLDNALESSANRAAPVWQAFTEWRARTRIWDPTEQGRKDFEALSRELGNYMPFENAAKMAERKVAGTKAVTTAQITGKVNQVSAALMLRIMEVGHPILNLSGMVNAMPAVIRNMQPNAGESTQDFAARIGHSANIFTDGTNPIGVIDMPKLASRAFARAWNRSSHADYDFMVQRGYLTQEVAEFQRQFGAINGKQDFNEFFDGKVTLPSGKKVVDWMSTLSDKSEDFSRSWGHMIGLELADTLGIKGLETRNMFAHDIANKMIANYNPANRPEVFQGALGAPIGLFQSFVQNYYQRLFRYIETKDGAAFATQYASQSALFGMTGLAGWDQMNSFAQYVSSGEEDLSGDLHSKFRGDSGDLLAHGLLSSIPKIFGAEGVDLYSRGDTTARVPGVGGNQLPGQAIAQTLWEGINAGVRLFKESNPAMTQTQVAEVLSNMVVNRPITGMIEQLAANGNDTDRFGQLVTDTQSAMETTYRILGLRSMRQSQNTAAFYADKTAQEYQAALKDNLRMATRSIIRDGTLDENADAIFTKYLEVGGDPRHFRRWLKANLKSATTPVAERQAERLMKNPETMDRALRFIDMGVGVDDDEKLPDMVDTYGYPDEMDQDSVGVNTMGR